MLSLPEFMHDADAQRQQTISCRADHFAERFLDLRWKDGGAACVTGDRVALRLSP